MSEISCEIEFRGLKATGILDPDNPYIELPVRTGTDGKQHQELISRYTLSKEVLGNEKKGWRLISKEIGTEGENDKIDFEFILVDDGSMVGKKGSENVYKLLQEEKFSKTAIPRTFSEKMALDIYKAIKVLTEYLWIERTAETVGTERERLLSQELELLGYTSIADVKRILDPDKSYFSLRRIGNLLEEFRNLNYVYKIKNEDGSEAFHLDYDYAPNQGKCPEEIKSTENQISENKRYMDSYKKWRDEVRGVPVTQQFLLGMQDDIKTNNPKDWIVYSTTVKSVAELILSLNKDLLLSTITTGKDYSNLRTIKGREGTPDTTLEDVISEVIDSEKFAKACQIEDEWVASQCRSAEKVLSQAEIDVGHSVVLQTELAAVAREVMASRKERDEAIKKYNELQEKYIVPKQEGAGVSGTLDFDEEVDY